MYYNGLEVTFVKRYYDKRPKDPTYSAQVEIHNGKKRLLKTYKTGQTFLIIKNDRWSSCIFKRDTQKDERQIPPSEGVL